MDCKVRPMAPGDIESVWDLVAKTPELTFCSWEKETVLVSEVGELSQVAECNGVITGVLFVGNVGTRVLLTHLVVDHQMRRHGVASRLVSAALKAVLALESHPRRVLALVDSKNDQAQEILDKSTLQKSDHRRGRPRFPNGPACLTQRRRGLIFAALRAGTDCW